jgi:hypothetical protein
MATYTGDQGGGDLILANGDYIHGIISNCRIFKMPAGATIYVTPHDGSDHGSVEVQAGDILIGGILDASGVGYGAGGGGGGGATAHRDAANNQYRGGAGGSGEAGGGNGEAGLNYLASYESTSRRAGAGGLGGGPFGGAAGAYGSGAAKCSHAGTGGAGGLGGYAGTSVNGDTSEDEAISMGSGGGGGGGGGGNGERCPNVQSGYAGPGGGAGGRGGGAIKLVAANSLTLSGTLLTYGLTLGGNGTSATEAIHGKPGGSAATAGSCAGGERILNYGYYTGRGGAGSSGAGGGICLVCNGPFGIDISGAMDTRGGENNTTNFGSIKIFQVKNTGSITGNVYGGWNDVYGTPYNPENKTWVHVC